VFIDFHELELEALQLERLMKAEKIEAFRGGGDCAAEIAIARSRGQAKGKSSHISPVAATLLSQLIFLPLHLGMTADDVSDAAYALQKVIDYFVRKD